MSEEKQHATYSASGSKRWLNCHGSINLSKKAPPQFESKYAKEGTDAHRCLELLLKHSDNALVLNRLKNEYPPDMIGNALFAYKAIHKMLDETLKGTLLIESRADLSFIEPNQFGTLDAAIWDPATGALIVIDYKYGVGEAVDAKNNTQMIYYALALANEHGFENVDAVHLVIIQPRAEHKLGPIREFEMGITELRNWENIFKEAIKQTKNPLAKLTQGEWCRYCPATTICPEISKKSLVQAKIDFNDVSGEVTMPDAKTIAIENLGQILTAAERIEFWISEVRAHALQVLERSHKVEGWKLVEKRSTRKWIDAEKTEKEAKKKFGSKAFTTDLLSPAQLEKVVDKEWVAKRVTNISSGTTIVPESDSRPAIVRAQSDFDAIEEGKPNGKTPRRK